MQALRLKPDQTKSHFQEMNLPWAAGSSSAIPYYWCTEARIHHPNPDFSRTPHTPEKRHLLALLSGRLTIHSGTESREMLPSDVMMVEVPTAGQLYTIQGKGDVSFLSLVVPAWVPAAGPSELPDVPRPKDGERMHAFPPGRMTEGPGGYSHVVPMSKEMAEGVIPIIGVGFNRSTDTTGGRFHNAPRRQMVVTLTGFMGLEFDSGYVHQNVPGEVALADDLTGKGHITRYSGERRTLFIPLLYQ